MQDFDAVLERLLGEPAFQAALAADPVSALAGYTLSAEERELLHSHLVTGAGAGGEHGVETRTNKSGVVGLLGPVVATLGVAMGSQTVGSAPAPGALGSAPGGREVLGAAPIDAGTTGSSAGESVGAAADAAETLGNAGLAPAEEVGSAAGGSTSLGAAPPAGYHTRVDVDGDGRWDPHTLHRRADGGVDIHVDFDDDGVVDFIGHDHDGDRLVDTAEYDTDFDGVMDTRMYDDTGDGWLDRAEEIPESSGGQSFGSAPSA